MGNPEGKRPFGKPRRRWEVILTSQKKGLRSMVLASVLMYFDGIP
jgi:hypothetical protein